MNPWATLMLVAGGLFAGGALSIAWTRVPVWRRMAVPQFVDDFGRTLHRTDKVQPALLIVAAVSASALAATEDGRAAVLAGLGAAGFVAVLVASVTVLVPLQRRLIASPVEASDAIEAMRRRWFTGNLGRTVLATSAFVAMVAAVTAG